MHLNFECIDDRSEPIIGKRSADNVQDSIGYNIDSKNDYPDIIDAHEMKCHIENLSRKFPGTQCALVVVRVPAESESPSDPYRSSDRIQTFRMDLQGR